MFRNTRDFSRQDVNTVIAAGLCLAGILLLNRAYSQELPSMDFDGEQPRLMTPVSDLQSATFAGNPDAEWQDDYIVPVSELERADFGEAASPAEAVELSEEPSETREAAAKKKSEPVESIQTAALTPAVDTSDHAKTDQHIETVTYYTPIPAIAVFPVMRHGSERTFADIPVLFAREFALRLEDKAAGSRIINPVYGVERMRLKNVGYIYDQVMNYYLRAGRPEPLALDYLLRQIEDPDRPISRVVFVEAALDTNNPKEPKGLWGIKDWAKRFLLEAEPMGMRYRVNGRVQVFDTEDPDIPKLWSFNWRRTVDTEDFYNVTPSVFDDLDSQRLLAGKARQMSRELLFIMPRDVYLDKHVETGVRAEILSRNPNAVETETLKRILNRD